MKRNAWINLVSSIAGILALHFHYPYVVEGALGVVVGVALKQLQTEATCRK